MSVSYTWVGWNRQKKIYDGVVTGGVLAFIVLFVVLGKVFPPPGEGLSDEILILRALGTCAFVLLHIVLCIGPTVRLDPRLLPLLYNRRHLGVITFLVALAHAVISLVWYHGFGNINPLLSLLTANTNFGSISQFPFELLGLAALIVLFVMAATSHDFWLKNLSPRVWKTLHMSVYGAYAALVLHVALGAMQSEHSPLLAASLLLGVSVVGGLHMLAALQESRRDRPINPAPPAHPASRGSSTPPGSLTPAEPAWIDVGDVDEIPEKRAKVVCLRTPDRIDGERVAVFRYDGRISVVSNVCEHQHGPLGEGKIVGGCITCPWHGYQYLPESGASPPPFTEKIRTYQVRVEGRRILVNPEGLPKGTPVEPARFEEAADARS